MARYMETKNYIWSTDDKLGTGATAVVFKGFDKNNAEPVAIKSFYKRLESQEIRVHQRINHENIVKLLGIEETSNGNKVIIMELCTGNSLSKVLQQPQNDFGLTDSEFLLVLNNLYDGIKYLRDNNLIHRDLKPDNIMKCILDDGSSIYKLTDFGAARELEEGEQFQSIHGTEEYLHPDMYERAFITRNTRNFDGTVDLWSLGVTLYHAATGSLPFRPYGGRLNRDKTAMYNITSRKGSGVISGIQTKPNGSVCYSKELPKNCLMSDDLKRLITPLLAGLMEYDISKTWNFTQFFNEVENIISRKIVYIFCVNQFHLLTLYMPLTETVENFQEIISTKTGIEKDCQLLIFKNNVLEMEKISDLPNLTQDSPLFLFNKNNHEISFSMDNDLRFEVFRPQTSIDTDVTHCRFLCKMANQYKREIAKYTLYRELMSKAVENFTNYINNELNRLDQKVNHILEMVSALQIGAKFEANEEFSNELSAFNDDVNVDIRLINQQKARFNVTCEALNQIGHLQLSSSNAKAATYVELLTESYKQFIRNKVARILSHNEQKLHFLEKSKVNHLMSKLLKLLKNIADVFDERTIATFNEWYNTALSINSIIRVFQDDIAKFEQKLTKYQEDLNSFAYNKNQKWANPKENLESLIYAKILSMLEKWEGNGTSQKLINENFRLSCCLSDQLDSLDLWLLDYKKLS